MSRCGKVLWRLMLSREIASRLNAVSFERVSPFTSLSLRRKAPRVPGLEGVRQATRVVHKYPYKSPGFLLFMIIRNVESTARLK